MTASCRTQWVLPNALLWEGNPKKKECPCSVAQCCLTLHAPIDRGPAGSSVHGTILARTLEQVANSSSRRSSQPRDGTQVHIAGASFTTWAIREAGGGPGRVQSMRSQCVRQYWMTTHTNTHTHLNRFAVKQKPAPLCKATIPQFKNKMSSQPPGGARYSENSRTGGRSGQRPRCRRARSFLAAVTSFPLPSVVLPVMWVADLPRGTHTSWLVLLIRIHFTPLTVSQQSLTDAGHHRNCLQFFFDCKFNGSSFSHCSLELGY